MPTAHHKTVRTIAGHEVELDYELAPLTALRLDPENPRIRFQIRHGTRSEPKNQAELLAVIRDQPGYEPLLKQIRQHGSIHDPLYVRHDGRIIEGNTRYAVATLLDGTNTAGEKWKRLPVYRFPADAPEEIIQLLMADFHIAGKTTWRPVGQADQIHRLIRELKVDKDRVATTLRMSVKEVEQTLDAYDFLLKEVLPFAGAASTAQKQEILESRFSHALELMKRKDLKEVRENTAERKNVARAIAEGRIKGAEMRQLSKVLKHTPAKKALLAKDFKAAKAALERVDPAASSPVVGLMERLTEKLMNLSGQDLELFKENEKAQRVLEGLDRAVSDLIGLSESGKRRGVRHASL
jgi:hypothetical protein